MSAHTSQKMKLNVHRPLFMNAAKEVKNENLSIRDGLKKIGTAFLSTREVSSQECVYRCMPELWLRKTYPATVFVSTDLPEKRARIAKCEKELEELDDESTDIFKSNIIERYTIRPQCTDSLCLAEFTACYYKDYEKDCQETGDAQPEILTDDVIELQHCNSVDSVFPNRIRLMNSNEIMKCRRVRAVIRYHKPNKTKEPEQYFHHLLMLYYPWRDENSLLGTDQTRFKISDDKLREAVRSSNNRQRYAYDIILSWCRNKMKNLNSLKPNEVKPIYLFITGGAGAGTSHLTVSKTFKCAPVNSDVLTTFNIDIILGDFNINFLHDDSIRPLESLVSSFGYSQIVQSPTFISAGSMADQVYIKTSHLDIVQNSVLSVYYSDHDAVQASLKMKKEVIISNRS